jgi:hypothetical protein
MQVSFVRGYEGPDQAVNQVRTNDADPGLPERGQTALYHRRVADPMIAPGGRRATNRATSAYGNPTGLTRATFGLFEPLRGFRLPEGRKGTSRSRFFALLAPSEDHRGDWI